MKHIALTIDHNFVRYCAVTVVSILKNDSPQDIYFHILGNNLTSQDQQILTDLIGSYHAQVAFYSVPDAMLQGYSIRWEGHRLPMIVFYRCILASVLPVSVTKVLYLDCDVLVLQSLDELWNTDLTHKAIAGVPDSLTVNPQHCKRLGYDTAYNYFNGGVLLLNLAYWREHRIEQQCKEYYQHNLERMKYNDQDLLNGLLHQCSVLLPMKWNVQEGAYRIPQGKKANWMPPYISLLRHPAILHFSARKPWQYHCMHPMADLFFQYQDLTPWNGEHPLNQWWPRTHRYIHLLPYTIGWKKNIYFSPTILQLARS